MFIAQKFLLLLLTRRNVHFDVTAPFARSEVEIFCETRQASLINFHPFSSGITSDCYPRSTDGVHIVNYS